MLNLVPPLAEQGWNTTVVLPLERGTGVERLAAAGIPLIQTPLHRLRATVNPKTHLDLFTEFMPEVHLLEDIIRQQDADLVQICGLMSLHGGIAAKRQDVPIVWQLLSTFAPPPLRQFLTYYVESTADVVMTTGMTIAHKHSKFASFGDRLISFFPPVDTNRYRPDAQQSQRARAELGVPDDGILVGTVGNRSRQKAHHRMVEAFAYLQQANSNLHFRILGAHTPSNAEYYQTEVMARAERLGLLKYQQLQFVEPGNRVVELLPAFDIFVLTSIAEGTTTAIIEAMACGVPVVAMDVGGVGDVVVDGKTGLLVQSTNPRVFGQAVEKLLHDSTLRAQMSVNSRQYAVAELDIANCVALHRLAYERAMQHHRANSVPALSS
jgi:glycosyltransferase involved in cell wall biosynthesis